MRGLVSRVGAAVDHAACRVASAGAPAHVALLVAAAALLLLPGLGRYPLLDPSEGRPAAIARQMDQQDRWLVPVLHGERYDDKPAPFYWILRATAHLPLRAETAARLPSATATLATALVLYAFARSRLGPAAALAGGLVYLTCPAVVGLGRTGTQDALLAALVSAAIAVWLAWLDRPRSTPWAAYALMGAGSLIKGPVAIVLPLLVAGACARARGVLRDRLRRAGLARGLALGAAILLAWLVPAAVVEPGYARGLLFDHHLRRYLTGAVGHPEASWYLVPALLGMLLPWSLVLPVVASGRSADRGERRVERDLLLWAAAIVLFFSLGRAKLATYVLPAMPPLALWIGARLVRLARDPGAGARQRTPLRLVLAAWAAALALTPLGVWAYLRREFPDLAWAAAIALPLPLLGAAGLRLGWRQPERLRGTALAIAAGNVAIVLIGYLFAAPVASRIASDAAIARTATALAPGVPIVGFRIQPSSLAFYATAPVRKLKHVDDVLRRAREGPLLLVAREKGAAALRAAGLELHRWTDCARHCLYATVPPPVSVGGLTTDRGPSS